MGDADREKMLRDMAANRGCKLVKSRRRTPGAGDYGRYGLKDAVSGREVFGFGAGGLAAEAAEIEAFLRKGAAADWKSSLAAAGAANDERTPVARRPARKAAAARPAAAPRPPPKLRAVSKPEPEPLPSPPRPALDIREARAGDAPGVAALLEAAAPAVAARITALRRTGTPPLVAEEDGEILGCCAFHILPLLHDEAPLGRLTLLLVAHKARRRGVGRALVAKAEARLADLGCARIEALAEIELAAAPDFFRRLGWARSAYRYARTLEG